MSKGRVVYIDEDPDDIVYFQEFMDGHFSLEIITIVNDSDINEVIDDIINSPPDAVVTDFMLNEKATVGFNGQALIELLQERNKHIPCFLLTSHAPDALEATHDARLVQAKAVMMNNDLKSLFRAQIAKVIEDHKLKLTSSEEELEHLLNFPRDSLTAQQRQRIIELDTYLEEHGLSSNALPDELKNDRSLDMLTKLVGQVDALLSRQEQR
ncbi:response regulator [Pseudomonas putida]|uniref:response regulator n=1 Tax=Pseudomonas putida TaxID=303 RepID=UPI002757A00A|nr:response regulator [Pseudomonas putida]MDP9521940.1 response regulator [Pseudomonas putida]